jgi:hypothetical protein
MWDRHVLPHLGRYRLKEITPEVVTNWRILLIEGSVSYGREKSTKTVLYAPPTRRRRKRRIWLYRAKPTEGFEPSTPALRERCSGHLSYVGVGRRV